MEARQRVGRSALRRDAARASITRAREALRVNASQDKKHGSSPPLQLDLRSKSELAQAQRETLERDLTRTSHSSLPHGLWRFTREANRSWQRGALVLEERERQRAKEMATERHASHFPAIEEGAGEAPLIYPPMRPGYIMRSLVPTPFQSEITETSATTETASPEPYKTTPQLPAVGVA